MTTLFAYWQRAEKERCAVEDFKEFHYNLNPALTEAAKHNLEIFFADLANEETPDPAIAEEILETCYTREVARQCGEAAVQIINGKSRDLTLIEKPLIAHKNNNLLSDSDTPVSEDLDALLASNINNMHWKFNLTSLASKVEGTGPGVFTIVAGRIEMGKTALWTSLVAAPGGFAWQGAKTLVFKNEEKGERDHLRIYSSASGFCYEELLKRKEEAKEIYKPLLGRVKIYNAVGWDFPRIDKIIESEKPDIVVIDMLDKVAIDGEFARTDEKLKEIYINARQRAITKDLALFGFSQLSADAHDKLVTDMSMLENSRTGKGAEADIAICIGARSDMPYMRQLNICKNKITGNHEPVMLRIQPEISRYTE